MALPSDELCPISDGLLGRLYRSTPEGLAVLVRTVPPSTRAMLAYYCSRRAHLESLGLAIALACSPEDLYEVAGRAGLALLARAQSERPAEPQLSRNRRGITLSSGVLWKIPT